MLVSSLTYSTGAEEEHPVAQDRTADRPAPLLAAVGDLFAIVLLREVVLRGQRLVPGEDEPGAVEHVGPRLGDHRDRDAARAPVRRAELTRGELELFEALEREVHQRPALAVVAVVGAVNGRAHVRARAPAEGHVPDTPLGRCRSGSSASRRAAAPASR